MVGFFSVFAAWMRIRRLGDGGVSKISRVISYRFPLIVTVDSSPWRPCRRSINGGRVQTSFGFRVYEKHLVIPAPPPTARRGSQAEATLANGDGLWSFTLGLSLIFNGICAS